MALKYRNETLELCCASGKVKFAPLVLPPVPLRPLISGTRTDFNYFLTQIQKYYCFNHVWLSERFILAAKNIDVNEFNLKIQNEIFEELKA